MRVYIYSNESGKLLSLINMDNVPNVGDKITVEDTEFNVISKSPNVDVNNRIVYFNLRVE